MAVSLKKYLICAVMLCLAGAARAGTWQGTCVSVLDGDSLMITGAAGKKEVRLYGIDTPEFDQAFGRQARSCTRGLVLDKKVTVEPFEIDKYGRTVAKVRTAEGCVNELLVARGCAWVYRRYCRPGDITAWAALEEKARQQGLGLWSQPGPVPPWDFRSTKRAQENKQVKKTGAAAGFYHGNTGSRVFHAPGCTAYDCKNCTAAFNSLGEALRAGYSPCKKCIDN